jgi:hypothetical protein
LLVLLVYFSRERMVSLISPVTRMVAEAAQPKHKHSATKAAKARREEMLRQAKEAEKVKEKEKEKTAEAAQA